MNRYFESIMFIQILCFLLCYCDAFQCIHIVGTIIVCIDKSLAIPIPWCTVTKSAILDCKETLFSILSLSVDEYILMAKEKHGYNMEQVPFHLNVRHDGEFL